MKPIIVSALCAIAGAAAMPTQSSPVATSSITTYDLTYTLKIDRTDPSQVRMAWDHAHFVASLQGIVNRRQPNLYVYLVGDETGRIDRYWWTHLHKPGEWLSGRRATQVSGIGQLAHRFRRLINGLVVYDERVPATSNVASTIAGVSDLACVRYDPAPNSLYTLLTTDSKGPRLPVKVRLINPDGTPMFTGKGNLPGSRTASSGSAKCDAYLWAKEKYLDTGLCDPTCMGYYIDAWWLRQPEGYLPNHTLSNHDYVISRRGFFFDLGPWDDETPVDDRGQAVGTDERTLRAILKAAWNRKQGKAMIQVAGFLPWAWKYTNYGHAGGTHDPVPGEWRYAEVLSCHNAYMDADAIGLNAMANASLFRLHPLKAGYPQSKPTPADLRRQGYVDVAGHVARKNYVAIYGGDYDAAAWLYQRLPDLWDDPARGTIPVGWAFNPNLAQRFPVGMDWARRTAKPGDVFIAGDSGAGYINPGHLVPPRRFSGLPSGLVTWETHCTRYYRQWGLDTTGFVIDGYAPAMTPEILDAYARFSGGGIVGQKVPRLGMHGAMPIISMEWDVYSAEAAAEVMAERCTDSRPGFFVYRTILWKPTDLKRMMDLARAAPGGNDIEFVDPHTLMALIKQFQTGPDAGKATTGPVRLPAPGERANIWALRAGAEVINSSTMVPGCDARDLFGGRFGTVEDHATVLFADDKPNGTIHSVEWRTAKPVLLDEYRIHGFGDGSNQNREFSEARLLARASGEKDWRLVDTYTPAAHPYRPENEGTSLLASRKLASPIAAQEFRLELVQRSVAGMKDMGPRITELVGLGTIR